MLFRLQFVALEVAPADAHSFATTLVLTDTSFHRHQPLITGLYQGLQRSSLLTTSHLPFSFFRRASRGVRYIYMDVSPPDGIRNSYGRCIVGL